MRVVKCVLYKYIIILYIVGMCEDKYGETLFVYLYINIITKVKQREFEMNDETL